MTVAGTSLGFVLVQIDVTIGLTAPSSGPGRSAGAPPALTAARRIARWRMAYLLACAAVERQVLAIAPSRRLGDALALVKSLPIRD